MFCCDAWAHSTAYVCVNMKLNGMEFCSSELGIENQSFLCKSIHVINTDPQGIQCVIGTVHACTMFNEVL